MVPAVILVVDDDLTRLKLVSRLLSQAGHQVLEASSGQQALSLAQSQPPDLFLVDEVLPDISGTALCQQVKGSPSLIAIPIAVFSSHRHSAEAIAAALNAGADAYITWPIDHGEFNARINTLLRLKQTQDELRRQETLYRQLYQTMTSGVAVYEIRQDGGRVIFKDINLAGEAIGQVQRESTLGRDVRDVFPGVIDTGLFEMLVRVGCTGEPERLPGVLYQDRRIARWVENYVYRLANSDVVAVYDDITERVSAERVLQEKDDLLSAVFDTDPNCIFVKDESGRYVLVNRAITELYGCQTEDMLGRTDADLAAAHRLTPADSGSFLRDDLLVAQEGLPRFIPLERFSLPDGTTRWFQTIKVPLKFADSNRYVLGIASDVTEQKQAEASILESDRRYRILFETMAQGVFYQGADGTLFDVNDAALEMFGLTKDQFLGRTSLHPEWQVVNEDGAPLAGPEHPSMVALISGKPVRGRVFGVYNPVRQDWVWVSLNATPEFRPGENQAYRVFVTMHDITERKRAEEALRRSEKRYRLLAENATDVIWTMDVAGHFTYVSPSVEKLRGYTAEEVLRQTLAEALTPESSQMAVEWLQQALAAAQEGRSLPAEKPAELEQPRKDGSTVWTEVVTSLLTDQEGNIIGVQGVSRDITERRRLEAQIMEAQRMEAVGQLAAGIAHDFNNLLTGVNGFAELLQMEILPDDPRRHMVDIILQSGTRAAQLVQQMLAFARKQTVRPLALDWNETLLSLSESMQQSLGPEIVLDTVLLPGLWPTLLDPGQAEQIIRNLIANARRVMPEGGHLRVETRNLTLTQSDTTNASAGSPGDYVTVIFHDTGPVLPDAHQSRIFEPFFFTSREVADGTGLRLAAVYGIVRQNGGHIHVISREGEGARLEIRLPRHPAGS